MTQIYIMCVLNVNDVYVNIVKYIVKVWYNKCFLFFNHINLCKLLFDSGSVHLSKQIYLKVLTFKVY